MIRALGLFQNRPPAILCKIVEKIHKKIKTVTWSYQGAGVQNYQVLTDKSYLEVRISPTNEPIETEVSILEYCRKKGIKTLPKVKIGKLNYGKGEKWFYLIEEIKGNTLATSDLSVFDFNKVLASMANFLYSIHSIDVDGFGHLNSTLQGSSKTWDSFLNYDSYSWLKILNQKDIFPKKVNKVIEKYLYLDAKFSRSLLLHGNISSLHTYFDKNLNVTTLGNFSQPISGDPNYDFSGFMLYDGADRARRLVGYYNSLGGQVEWNSDQFKMTFLKRVIRNLYTSIVLDQNIDKKKVENINRLFEDLL